MNRIQNPYTIAKHAPCAAALFAVVLTFAGLANADAMHHSHKAKSGHLTIAGPTEVGGFILQPGDYEVREVNAANGPVLEFVHQFRNEAASELVQADEEEVVARVNFTEQALSSPPKRTQLMLASNPGDVTGLEIRGSAVGYSFAPSALSAAADTAVQCANSASK